MKNDIEEHNPHSKKSSKSGLKLQLGLLTIILLLVVIILVLVFKRDKDYVIIQNPDNPTEYKYIEEQKYLELEKDAIEKQEEESLFDPEKMKYERIKEDEEERQEIMKNFEIPNDGDTAILIDGKLHVIKINKEDLKRFQDAQRH